MWMYLIWVGEVGEYQTLEPQVYGGVHVLIHVSMSVCLSICMYACIHVCMPVCMCPLHVFFLCLSHYELIIYVCMYP